MWSKWKKKINDWRVVWHSDKYCLSRNQFCFSTKHGSLAIYDLTDWQDFTSNDSNTIHRRLERDHWSRSRKADKDKNPNFMRWMTDVKQPALQRHLAGVTPWSNVLRMCERVGQIGGPTLKCIWHNFFLLAYSKDFSQWWRMAFILLQ